MTKEMKTRLVRQLKTAMPGGESKKCKYEGKGVWEGRCVGTKEVDPCKGYEKCKSYRPDCQTNADRIRAMSDEQMVRNNIRLSYRCDIDYDYDGKPYENWKQYYETSDGSAFYEEKDAMNRKKILQFPSYNVSLGEAVSIVKYKLDDDSISIPSKVLATKAVAEMETHNSITKNDLVNALRWLFEHYDFEEDRT